MTLSAVTVFGICASRYILKREECGVYVQQFEAEYLISHSLDLCI